MTTLLLLKSHGHLAFIDGTSPFRIFLLHFFRAAAQIAVHELRNAPAGRSVHLERAHAFHDFRLPFPADVEDRRFDHVDLHFPSSFGCFIKFYQLKHLLDQNWNERTSFECEEVISRRIASFTNVPQIEPNFVNWKKATVGKVNVTQL